MWWVIGGLFAAGLLALLYARVEASWFVLRRHVIPCLPAGSEPLTVLHVSDTHFRSTLKAMPRFFDRRLATLRPDLVVGTGDFLGDTTSAARCAAMLSSVPARLGRIFVLGSNDYYAPVPKNPLAYFTATKRDYKHGPRNETWTELVAELESRGWQFLRNDRTRIDGIEISGLDDPHIGLADMTAAPPRSGDGFRLAVVHSPQVARKLAANGFDLIVAGHTHGGQIRVPGVGALVTNTPGLPRHMARGAHRLGDAWLHVTAGLGTSKFAPIRFACRPEACLLELTPRT